MAQVQSGLRNTGKYLMLISDLRVEAQGDRTELSALVRAETARKGDFRVWFRMPTEYAPRNLVGDPFLAGFLVPCMWSGECLHIEAPVSEALLEQQGKIQKLIRGWFPDFREIDVSSAEKHGPLPNRPANPGVASFFSGGIDSWYTLLRNGEAISHMVLVHGFDIKISEQKIWERTRTLVAQTAAEIGKRLVIVETNLKKVGDPRRSSWGRPYQGRFWTHHYIGSALAAVGLCMQDSIRQIHIPASHRAERTRPYGTHPELDPLWSSHDLKVVYDGNDAGRFGKIYRQVRHSDVALRALRVCLLNDPGQFNCCRCEKCMRTMLGLRLAGVLERTTTFPHPLPSRQIAQLIVPRELDIEYEELLDGARLVGNTEFVRAIEILLRRRFSLHHTWGLTRHLIGKWFGKPK